MVLPKPNEPHVGTLLDLNMMVMTGGRERTEKGYVDLFAKSGFRLARVVATKSPFSVIEALPAYARGSSRMPRRRNASGRISLSARVSAQIERRVVSSFWATISADSIAGNEAGMGQCDPR